METITTENLINKFSILKSYQQKKVVEYLNNFSALNLIDADLIAGQNMICRKCGSSNFVKNGTHQMKYNLEKTQRFQCKTCKCTQYCDANTVLYNLKIKDKWIDFVYIMLANKEPMDNKSISEILEISERTAFRWRHKFLSSLNKINPLSTQEEIEVDEVYFRFNVKGRIGKEKFDEYYGYQHPDNIESELRKKERFMKEEKYQTIFLCRHNRTDDFEFSPIKIQNKGIVAESDLQRVMKDFDLTEKTIITDKEPSMISYMKTLETVNHLTFRSSDIKKGILDDKNVHNNNINSMMASIRQWFKKFRGVSTKYLENYLKWFRYSNLFKLLKLREMLEYSLLDKESYPRFKNLFKIYKEFIYI
ncbi:MAG: IS1595 family transposase [Desulfobacterales bacterium]|nr:IS1595 family transposase [Desulfobacterales bacterium]